MIATLREEVAALAWQALPLENRKDILMRIAAMMHELHEDEVPPGAGLFTHIVEAAFTVGFQYAMICVETHVMEPLVKVEPPGNN